MASRSGCLAIRPLVPANLLQLFPPLLPNVTLLAWLVFLFLLCIIITLIIFRAAFSLGRPTEEVGKGTGVIAATLLEGPLSKEGRRGVSRDGGMVVANLIAQLRLTQKTSLEIL